MRHLACTIALLLALATPALGQPVLDVTQRLGFDRPESWAMKYFTSAALFTGFGAPRALEPGSIELGLEVDWLPSLSARQRRVGFNGTKVEDINRSAIFPRPRILIGLPKRFSLDVSYVPPVEIYDIEPQLLALSIGRPVYESSRWRSGLRLYGQYGKLRGDITCPKDEAAAGPDPERNPFFCEEPSDDEMTTRSGSLELSGSLKLRSSDFEPYAALGANYMDLDFQVRARYAGIIDRTRQLTEGWTWYATTGFRYEGWKRSLLGVEIFYTPLEVIRPPSTSTESDDLLNVRVFYSYRIR